jgi:adenosylhomocysteinase
MAQAAETGDFFVTVTGCNNAIRREHMERMKDGAVLANAGHFDVEISKPDLEALSEEVKEVRTNIRGYRMADGHSIYLLADGRLVNLAAADGHPAEIMDMTFALQVSSLLRIASSPDLSSRVYPVPADIDEKVARLMMKSLGVEIDSLTSEQVAYLRSWRLS